MDGKELISKRTRIAFREFLVGWTLREIENAFSASGLEPDQSYDPKLGGQRREFVEQYYHAVDFTDPREVEKVLRVCEEILTHCELHIANTGSYYDSSLLKPEYEKLLACLRRDGYEFDSGRIRFKAGHATIKHLTDTAIQLDADYLVSQIDRLREAVELDPDLAIGQAKELIETCCKTILEEVGDSGYNRLDLVPLVKRTMKHLKLLPEDIPDSAKGVKTIKAILGNLAMLSQGMAELRNLYGTGHGKHGGHKRLPIRHARLAVGAAITLATFLFDTHSARSQVNNKVSKEVV